MQPDFANNRMILRLVFLGPVGDAAHEAARSFHAKLGNPGELQILDAGGETTLTFEFDPDWVEPHEGLRLSVLAIAPSTGDEFELTRRVALQGVDAVAFARSGDEEAEADRLEELSGMLSSDVPIAHVHPGFGNEWAPVRDLVTQVRAQLP